MKVIKTTKGQSVKVDDADFDWLNEYKWFAHSGGYAATKTNGRSVLMHRLIMNTPEGMDTDHINRDKSDNRRLNLRVCTRAENLKNRNPTMTYRTYKTRTDGTVGVNWNKSYGKWEVRLQINKKRKFYGRYEDKDEAVAVSRLARSRA